MDQEINTQKLKKFFNPNNQIEKATNYFIILLLSVLYTGIAFGAFFFGEILTIKRLIINLMAIIIGFGLSFFSLKIYAKNLFSYIRQIEAGNKKKIKS